MTILIAFFVLVVLMDVVIIISGWEREFVGYVSLAPITCWIIHFLKIGSDRVRLYLYVFAMFFVLLFYGYHGETVTDIPIILCVLILCLSQSGETVLIYIVAFSYVVYLLESIFVDGYLFGEAIDFIVYSRIILGVVCLILSVFISRYIFKEKSYASGEIESLEKDLLEAGSENEVFLANMSHELRTPINAVNGMSRIILDSAQDPEVKKQAQVINDAGRRLYRQVSDTLDYSELRTGHFSLFNENYEIASAVNDAITQVFDSSVGSKLDFALDLDSNVPRTLFGDLTKIKKIITCLLDNAVKFTERGGGYLYVSHREEEYGINLNIDVYDTGCGMTKGQTEHLFHEAYQVDSDAKRKKGGLGLGLSIVHGIVSKMDGFMYIESKIGEGTHVHVCIPQQVIDPSPSVKLEDASYFKIACYFNIEKYVKKQVGKYYYSMMDHVTKAQGLDVTFLFSLEDFKDHYKSHKLTNVFISDWEYEMEEGYFDGISKETCLFIFCEDGFKASHGCHAQLIRKPLYSPHVLNELGKSKGFSPKTSGTKQGDTSSVDDRYKNARVLVVDDEEMNLIVAKGILSKMGISADTANSGNEAIEKCSMDDYDIIFMDYMMPGMDGTSAMNRIRSIRNGFYRKLPIVVLTANAVSGAREGFLKDGFDDFLSKPIDIVAMKKVIDKKMSKRG